MGLLCGSDGKESAFSVGDQVWFLGWEDPLEKGMAIHSSILAWKIPWTEEPSGLQSMGLQRAGHYWATSSFTFSGSYANTVWENGSDGTNLGSYSSELGFHSLCITIAMSLSEQRSFDPTAVETCTTQWFRSIINSFMASIGHFSA